MNVFINEVNSSKALLTVDDAISIVFATHYYGLDDNNYCRRFDKCQSGDGRLHFFPNDSLSDMKG